MKVSIVVDVDLLRKLAEYARETAENDNWWYLIETKGAAAIACADAITEITDRAVAEKEQKIANRGRMPRLP